MTGDAITCAGQCGRVLTLPTTKEAAKGWRRHSLQWNLKIHFTYTCPTCPESKGLAVLETLKT
jgi:hypothetical protein